MCEALVGWTAAVPAQDRALRKRNLSGDATAQLRDSAAASVFSEAVLLGAEFFSTRVESEKLLAAGPAAVRALTRWPKRKSPNSPIAFPRSRSRKS